MYIISRRFFTGFISKHNKIKLKKCVSNENRNIATATGSWLITVIGERRDKLAWEKVRRAVRKFSNICFAYGGITRATFRAT